MVRIEINRIVFEARKTLNVSARIRILKRKAFKIEVGDPQRGGTYNYSQDCVFINQDVARLYGTSQLKWMIFHEFGHAYAARVFAKRRFLPLVLYESIISDGFVRSAISIMWQGLCDYFVNQIISIKLGLKKFDSTLEHTIDDLSEELASEMNSQEICQFNCRQSLNETVFVRSPYKTGQNVCTDTELR